MKQKTLPLLSHLSLSLLFSGALSSHNLHASDSSHIGVSHSDLVTKILNEGREGRSENDFPAPLDASNLKKLLFAQLYSNYLSKQLPDKEGTNPETIERDNTQIQDQLISLLGEDEPNFDRFAAQFKSNSNELVELNGLINILRSIEDEEIEDDPKKELYLQLLKAQIEELRNELYAQFPIKASPYLENFNAKSNAELGSNTKEGISLTQPPSESASNTETPKTKESSESIREGIENFSKDIGSEENSFSIPKTIKKEPSNTASDSNLEDNRLNESKVSNNTGNNSATLPINTIRSEISPEISFSSGDEFWNEPKKVANKTSEKGRPLASDDDYIPSILDQRTEEVSTPPTQSIAESNTLNLQTKRQVEQALQPQLASMGQSTQSALPFTKDETQLSLSKLRARDSQTKSSLDDNYLVNMDAFVAGISNTADSLRASNEEPLQKQIKKLSQGLNNNQEDTNNARITPNALKTKNAPLKLHEMPDNEANSENKDGSDLSQMMQFASIQNK